MFNLCRNYELNNVLHNQVVKMVSLAFSDPNLSQTVNFSIILVNSKGCVAKLPSYLSRIRFKDSQQNRFTKIQKRLYWPCCSNLKIDSIIRVKGELSGYKDSWKRLVRQNIDDSGLKISLWRKQKLRRIYFQKITKDKHYVPKISILLWSF